MTGDAPSEPSFERMALIGIGLIGSSLAHVARQKGLVRDISIATRRQETLAKAEDLGLGDSYHLDPAAAVAGADLVILCTPVGANASVAERISASLEPRAIVSDVGRAHQPDARMRDDEEHPAGHTQGHTGLERESVAVEDEVRAAAGHELHGRAAKAGVGIAQPHARGVDDHRKAIWR